MVLLAFVASTAFGAPLGSTAAKRSLADSVDKYGIAQSQLAAAELDVIESLRALASSNPQFAKTEQVWTEARNFWTQYTIKDCDFRVQADPVDDARAAKFMRCLTAHQLVRAEHMRAYAAELQQTRRSRGIKAPIPESFDCSFTEAELKDAKPEDACIVRTIAKRCNGSDACLIRCIATNSAKEIGGGCYHVCARYGLRAESWVAPKEASACFSR